MGLKTATNKRPSNPPNSAPTQAPINDCNGARRMRDSIRFAISATATPPKMAMFVERPKGLKTPASTATSTTKPARRRRLSQFGRRTVYTPPKECPAIDLICSKNHREPRIKLLLQGHEV